MSPGSPMIKIQHLNFQPVVICNTFVPFSTICLLESTIQEFFMLILFMSITLRIDKTKLHLTVPSLRYFLLYIVLIYLKMRVYFFKHCETWLKKSLLLLNY